MGQRAVVGKLVGDLAPAGAPLEFLPETIAEAEENLQRCVILHVQSHSYLLLLYAGVHVYAHPSHHNYYIFRPANSHGKSASLTDSVLISRSHG